MPKIKKSGIDWSKCGVCGGNYKKQSGFLICGSCGSRHEKREYDPRKNWSTGRIEPVIDSEDDIRTPLHLEGSGARYDYGIKLKG